MIQKFLSKYFFEVIPSIVATVVGAYIVTHYINSKPEAEKPPAAVSAPVKAAATPEPAKATEAKKVDSKETAKADPKPEPAKPVVKASRSSDKAEEKTEEAAIRHRPVAREAVKDEAHEKATVRAPVEAAREAASRDANELARDALARLRGSTEDAARASDTSRLQDAERPQRERSAVKVVYSPANNPAPAQVQPPAQPQQIPAARQDVVVPPMGPPVTIAPSPRLPSDASDQGARLDDPSHPTPPADIPFGTGERKDTSVAEDVVSAAKSVFEAVVPVPR